MAGNGHVIVCGPLADAGQKLNLAHESPVGYCFLQIDKSDAGLPDVEQGLLCGLCRFAVGFFDQSDKLVFGHGLELFDSAGGNVLVDS
jgi:hypothetical protein